jgi:hypothetical protein
MSPSTYLSSVARSVGSNRSCFGPRSSPRKERRFNFGRVNERRIDRRLDLAPIAETVEIVLHSR